MCNLHAKKNRKHDGSTFHPISYDRNSLQSHFIAAERSCEKEIEKYRERANKKPSWRDGENQRLPKFVKRYVLCLHWPWITPSTPLPPLYFHSISLFFHSLLYRHLSLVYAYRLFPLCFSLIALTILKMCACALQFNGILSVSVVYECLSEFVAAIAIVVLYDFVAIISLTSDISHCLYM